jgi:Protein of unknown function (DUF3618)
MTGPNDARPEPGPDAGIDDIQADIEHTRKELGETVGALSAKLVKERTKEKVADTKEAVVDKAQTLRHTATEKADTLRHTATDNPKRSVPVVALLFIGALTVGVVLWRRRR